MIRDLDETLKQLLIQKGGIDAGSVDIRFDAPSSDPAGAAARPTINFFLYDIRENVELREIRWDTQRDGNRQVRVKRLPLRMDLSYNVSCRASAVEDQHQLLWRVVQTLSRNSPLPDDLLQGDLKGQLHQVLTKVAQPDGVLNNPADLWSAAKSEPAPSINFVATLDLDLDQESVTPLVFARIAQVGPLKSQAEIEAAKQESAPMQSGWDSAPIRFGGVVRAPDGRLIEGASVRVLGKQADGSAMQVGPTVRSDESGHYVFSAVPAGQYTLVVEVPGQAPQQRPLSVGARQPGEPLPELLQEVEVKMVPATS